jgi:hypothetical protein
MIFPHEGGVIAGQKPSGRVPSGRFLDTILGPPLRTKKRRITIRGGDHIPGRAGAMACGKVPGWTESFRRPDGPCGGTTGFALRPYGRLAFIDKPGMHVPLRKVSTGRLEFSLDGFLDGPAAAGVT